MRKIIFASLFCLLASLVPAQKIRYGGMQQLGLTAGEGGTDLRFLMVNGIRFHRFFTGIGADVQFIGYHPYIASAVFADGRYYINKKKNFFGKINGGLNFITEKMESYPNYRSEKFPGYYAAFGIGFKAKLSEEAFYSFDVSYSIRQMRYNRESRNWMTNMWQTEKFDLRRYAITVNMGIEIF